MTKANDLASLLDANGDVVSSALDNVPASDLVNDTTPQLGGNLDLNSNNITGSGNLDVTGTVTADGLTVDTSDQVIINHSGDGGGIRIDSTNNTNTGSLRFGDAADNYIGAVEYNHSTDALSFYANNNTRMTISSAGNVGIGGDAGGYRLHVQNTDNGGTVYGRVLNACTAGTNSTAQMHVGTTSNTLLLSANEQYNYTQMSQAGNAINHYFDMDNYYFRNKAGTQYLAMTAGRISTQNRNYGLITHTSGITLADNASTTISAGTAGGGVLAIYNANSGRHATFGVGYGAVYLIGQSHSGVYVAGDVDGKFGIYSGGGHSFTLINRLGSSAGFYINLFMAGSNAA